MKAKLYIIKFLLAAAMFTSMCTTAFAETSDFKELPSKSQVSILKPFTVKVNLDLDASTINSTNIIVKDSKGLPVKVSIYPGDDSKSIVIYPQVGGYIPGAAYAIEISTNVKSKAGAKLSMPVKMNFTTSSQFEDETSNTALPSIKSIDILDKPLIQKNKTSFVITPNISGDVQYRVFLFNYPNETYDNSNYYTSGVYTELTSGYTSAISSLNPYTFTKTDGFELGKYKLLVYVKGSGRSGKYKDTNTDFDNFYSTYFKVLDKNILADAATTTTTTSSSITKISYSKTLEEAVGAQIKAGGPVYSETTGFMKANDSLLRYYMDPNNYLDDYGKYSFLVLNYMEVSVDDLNILLKGKGVLEGKGDVFLKAAKDNDINPIYLVSHSLLETGNGTSVLSNGILVSSVDGKAVEPKTTYNTFGVHAYDEDPNRFGSEYAYTQGWFTVDAAILGGAKFIGTNYINRVGEKQNTLYKMKWDINYSTYPHQYATDIGWPRKQIKRIKDLIEQCKTAKPVFEIPSFK
ncbi:beta-N-acetylglucosaminidase precursor [Clostridium homopropionicum DSM 5847]|uniref:Beta-N-acetylglucosaminidase n=1 Tax=Clostridium homopropionicum DSM 5847 TaxID=1121318 RepID=A0A0L6Z7R1_9CLOT|nr:N-acetylglucosaminidase [Clostridium homopropionicum]KOA19006.1 beta-N-acetylglucosaminidase precursor [Clostridium homopropionicum DSM 5847]SFG41935.1 mannosyl-glycoprotein endo-beta-N-acetylglucosaminidase [Clostridium homopropionicum]